MFFREKSKSPSNDPPVRWAEGAFNAASYMLVDRQAAWRLIWLAVLTTSCASVELLGRFGRRAARRLGAIIGQCCQAAWRHEAVAVESLPCCTFGQAVCRPGAIVL